MAKISLRNSYTKEEIVSVAKKLRHEKISDVIVDGDKVEIIAGWYSMPFTIVDDRTIKYTYKWRKEKFPLICLLFISSIFLIPLIILIIIGAQHGSMAKAIVTEFERELKKIKE